MTPALEAPGRGSRSPIQVSAVAAPPVDIDMVWLHGYGFPRWRAGPMYWAEQVGLSNVLRAILGYRERFGPDFWTPAPLLEECARSGVGLHALATPARLRAG